MTETMSTEQNVRRLLATQEQILQELRNINNNLQKIHAKQA